MSRQFLRRASLVVSKDGKGLDLSAMRIKFRVEQSDTTTPNNATIFVYNLSDETAHAAQKEFDKITLKVGYGDDELATIFEGTIKQAWRGRDNPVDTWLAISAADGDIPYNYGVVNKTLKAGSTKQDQIEAIAGGMGLPKGYVADVTAGATARGKVLYGMGRDHMDDVAASTDTSWSIQDGKLQVICNKSHLPGEAIVLTSNTGMVGWPIATEGGIEVRALINPRFRIGGLVQIDNRSIQRTPLGGSYLYKPGRLEDLKGVMPKITDDGFYRLYVVEHSGDTHGEEWFSALTCLAVDRSSPASSSVNPNA